MTFHGSTFNAVHDAARLATLLGRVHDQLTTGAWFTLGELQAACGGSEAGISARLRDLRKPEFGRHIILRRRRGDPKAGLWEYRLVLDDGDQRRLL